MLSISIIIPIYNVAQYVRRCIESVISQTDVDASLECIIVDDCTPDNSMEIVHNIIDAYVGAIRFMFLKHEENQGLSMARNNGIAHASGEYVLFIDSDDYLIPGSLHYMVEHLLQHPGTDIVIGNAFDVKNNTPLLKFLDSPLLTDNQDEFSKRMLHKQIYLYAWNKLIKRDLLVQNKLYFEKGILYEDILWTYQVFAHTSTLLLLPEITYLYEYNAMSIVNTTFSSGNSDKILTSYGTICNKLLDNPPNATRYAHNITVDYLLYIGNVLMCAVDVLLNCQVSQGAKEGVYLARRRLMCRSLSYGRLVLAVFFLLFFPPFNSVQRLSVFRHHYFYMAKIVNLMGHLTDWMHRKSM